MKHDQLCAIAHNLADSLASGLCFIIGYHHADVFGEAALCKDGAIEIDFLNGQIVRGDASDSLTSAAARFAVALPEFCRHNGSDIAHFGALSATFETLAREPRMLLSVADRNGHHSITEYAGLPMKRLRVLDHLGRIRRTPRQAVTIHR